MKNKILKTTVRTIATLTLFSMFSCDKIEISDNKSEQETTKEITIVDQGYDESAPLMEFRRNKALSKTFCYDYFEGTDYDTMFSTVKDFPYNSTANTYNVMKVWRKSDPNKYFWIMLENFRYKDDSSFVYDNKESNAQLYGRLYQWSIAKKCENKIFMRLPRRNADGTYTKTKYPTYGHLPTRTDILDLMEVDTLGHLPENGSSFYRFDDLDYLGYYDVFVSGRTYYGDFNEEAAYHTLAGWLNNTDFNPAPHLDYHDINDKVFFWTNDGIPLYHYPFRIYYNNGEYVAFINAAHANHYGFYVRYIFEPTQL